MSSDTIYQNLQCPQCHLPLDMHRSCDDIIHSKLPACDMPREEIAYKLGQSGQDTPNDGY